MKNIILTSLLIMASFSILVADWQIKSINFTFASDVFFINENTGWTVIGGNYSNSFIYKTTDAGKTWLPQNTGNRLNLYSIRFVDENYGWAGGYRGTFLRTTDGGENWHHPANNPISGGITDMFFVDRNTGWIISGDIYYTSDGGESFTKQQLPATGRTMYSVYFINSDEGWMSGSGGTILHTTNAGAEWTVQSSGQKHNLVKIQFINANEGFACGDYGGFYKTVNGGATWTISEIPQQFVRDMHFFDSKNGIMVDHNQLVLTTNNAGETWDVKTVNFNNIEGNPVLSAFEGIYFVNENNGWINSNSGPLITTTDGGQSWNIVSYADDLYRNRAVFSYNANEAIVAGYYGIFKTTDGGDSWTTKVSRASIYNAFEALSFEGNYGVAVGYMNKIFYTIDKGDTWTYDSTGYANGFSDVKVINGVTYATGTSGLMVKSTGNHNWQKLNLNSQESFYGLDFVNANTGWVAGTNATILKTVDGGGSWSKLEINAPGLQSHIWFTDVDFINENEGWVAGQPYFQLLHTTDGGQTWAFQTTGGKYNGNYTTKVQFLDSQNGWTITDGGDAWRTYDGGQSWERQILPDGIGADDFYFSDLNNGWLVNNAYVCKTNNGGSSIDYSNAEIGMMNDFDDGEMTKDFWEVKKVNANANWTIGNFENKNFSSVDNQNVFSAIIDPSSIDQDEWMMSPKFDIDYAEAFVEFYAGYDAASVNNAPLRLKIYSQGYWSDMWKATDDGQPWKWRRVMISLGEYAAQKNLRLAWTYQGANGGQTALDGIKLYSSKNVITGVLTDQLNNIPGNYKLYQNYPNPFNPVSNIKYEIAAIGHVNITVYDILGREVQVLVNEVKTPAVYEAQFNGAKLASGIYLCRMQAGKFTQVSKMVLIK